MPQDLSGGERVVDGAPPVIVPEACRQAAALQLIGECEVAVATTTFSRFDAERVEVSNFAPCYRRIRGHRA